MNRVQVCGSSMGIEDEPIIRDIMDDFDENEE